MSIIQARISGEDEALVMQYVKMRNISVSDLIREAVIEKIEDEIDLKLYQEAMAEFEKDPVTYSFDEVVRELGLNDEI